MASGVIFVRLPAHLDVTASLIGMQLMLCAFLIKTLEELRDNLGHGFLPEERT